jgi:hypothetical protein
MAKHKPEDDPTSLGNILVDMGMTTKECVREALGKNYPLGQAMVCTHVITETQLSAALIEQQLRRGEITRHQARQYRKELATGMAREACLATPLVFRALGHR